MWSIINSQDFQFKKRIKINVGNRKKICLRTSKQNNVKVVGFGAEQKKNSTKRYYVTKIGETKSRI